MPQPPKGRRQFADLVQVVETLRGPEGCPWDKEQTHLSLTRFAIEEAAEFTEAAERGQTSRICEELGDMLLQVVLNAEVARQAGTFTIEDVIESITEKMIRRHPHVFSDLKVADASEVKANWQKIKSHEKSKGEPLRSHHPAHRHENLAPRDSVAPSFPSSRNDPAAPNCLSALSDPAAPNDLAEPCAPTTPNELAEPNELAVQFRFDLPPQLPALLAAFKIGERTNTFHFDWSNPRDVLSKVEEELLELRLELDKLPEISTKTNAQAEPRSSTEDLYDSIALELGDLLFSMAQLARHLHLEPEQCLRQANRKFERRFAKMLGKILSAKRDILKLSPSELEDFWRQTKKDEASQKQK